MSVVINGLDELIRELSDLPEDLREEGMGIVREHTEGAAQEIAATYARKTGTLASRVRTAYPADQVLIGVVLSTAPHSHLYEWGTRQRTTGNGANRGQMPAADVTPKIAQRHRERMYPRLADMLRRRGFEVTGV